MVDNLQRSQVRKRRRNIVNQSLVYVRPFSPLFQILFFPLQFSSQKNCCWVVKYWGGAFGFPPPPPQIVGTWIFWNTDVEH